MGEGEEGIIPVGLYMNLYKNKDKGSIENATKEAPSYEMVKAKPIAAGKHVPGQIDWNPNPGIEFSHEVTDGSEEALQRMVDLIFSKYDTAK